MSGVPQADSDGWRTSSDEPDRDVIEPTRLFVIRHGRTGWNADGRLQGHCDEPLDAVVARALSGGTQGVMQVATSRPQNQTFKPGGNGQDPNQDQ